MQRGTLITAAPPPLAASALEREEFTRLVESLASSDAAHIFAVAVSGGPDSMALAFCLKRWGDEHSVKILALIVDHGLRAESAQEAKTTQQRLAALGIDAEILTWKHPPITSRLHIQARNARYELLTEACQRHGIHHLFLAHQREDQAETILMRLAKGSGIDGLAGISRQSPHKDIQLLRPLLNISKQRLIATCEAAGINFINDPSNQSEKFARGRLRRVLPLLADEGLTVERLLDLGERAAEAKQALEQTTVDFLRVASQRHEADIIHINLEQLRQTPSAIAQRALSLCLNNFSSGDYMPERASLLSLLAALSSDQDMTPRTLHGCLISKQSQQATLMREFSHVTETQSIKAGETVLWDGRWTIHLNQDVSSGPYMIAPLGNPPHESVDKLAPGLRHKVSQGRARATLPALWHDKKLIGIPSFTNFLDYPSLARAQLKNPWPSI